MKIRVLLGAPHDAQLLKQFAQHLFMAQALLDGRGNAKAHVFILGGKFSPLVDHQVARIVFGLEQVHVARPGEDEVVDLRDLALDALPGAHQFLTQPLLLAQVQHWRALQVFTSSTSHLDLSSADLSAIGSFWKHFSKCLDFPTGIQHAF